MNKSKAQTNEDLDNISARYQAILAAVPDIIMEVDENKVYTWANQAGKTFFGEDVIGKEADFFFEGEQKTYQKVAHIFKDEDDTVYVESLQRRRDGEIRLLAWWCRMLKDKNGNANGAISTARDITESRKAQENIANSQKLLQKIIDLLPIRIFWKDKNLNYLGCNQVFANDAGKSSPQELIGKDDFQMAWKEQAELYRSDDKSVLDSKKSKLDIEEPQTTPTGETIWLKTNKMPLLDFRDNLIGILGSYEDITARKQSEEIINKKIKETEDMNRILIGRELKMIELKKENEELKKTLLNASK